MAVRKGKKRYHIKFDIDIDFVDSAVRIQQIASWVRYCCGDKGRLRRDNPLYGKTLDPVYGTLTVAASK
jgi:hypothetical protein